MTDIYQNAPKSPGVYLMKDRSGRMLYIGKAVNLRRRVASYFVRAHDTRIQSLVNRIAKIEYRKTDSALEALILEAKLIKKHQPPFNVREKDNKSFLYIEITREEYPRILLVRGGTKIYGEKFGPFTSASSLREALKILKRIFPWNDHLPTEIGNAKKPCFNFELGLCPGTCIGATNRRDYLMTIRHIRLFLKGMKQKLTLELRREMKALSKKLEFEKAARLRKQIFALNHIRDTALIGGEDPLTTKIPASPASGHKPNRIEGYDISNISGTSAVGSMVVFIGNEPDRNEYRKFKIRTIMGQDDVGMLKEVMRRRFKRIPPAGARLPTRQGWPMPDLVLVDGGKPQVNAAKTVLNEFSLRIPIIGIAKGARRKKNEFIGLATRQFDKKILIRVRDEAHRFAQSYHKKLRTISSIGR